ncbi:aspartyl-tRNA synthetase, mitochondrial isoform X2 [Rhodnius prolixus]|uniref:aspartyl-tRNA synthetase, mitochondrial isoform X2 n=1 Tax=Rhodnius prolixus TaxID=13249 RepID=UPI003D18EBC4
MQFHKKILFCFKLFSKSGSNFSLLRPSYNVRNIHNKVANSYSNRTHTCGEITVDNINQVVTVCGWLHYHRMNKFAVLRDAYGSVQAFIPEERNDLQSTLSSTPLESVIEVTGKVHKRPQHQINKQMLTGEIEISVDDFKVINAVKKSLPFSIRDYNKANEATRMKFRYLDLRFPVMQRNLRFRSSFLMKIREFLLNNAFLEVETPTLFKKTPGGAQEFIVPTHIPGEFFSLVQSPQQFKQLLMVGGIDRYFQIARCYRDEGARPDRQPEFTQLDVEISFSDAHHVMKLIEDLLHYCWPNKSLITPFERITYSEAMQKYGSDKPDLIPRFPIITLDDQDASNMKKAIIISDGDKFITSSFRKHCEIVNKNYYNDVKLHVLRYKNSRQWQIDADKICGLLGNKINEHGIKENDFIFLAVGPEMNSLKLLGKVRSMYINIVKGKELNGTQCMTGLYRPLWIVDFPLFEVDEEQGILKPAHHPFTSPHPDDLHLLSTEPLKALID